MLQTHGLSAAEDDVLDVMDQIARWASPHRQL
jgi:hypothetical protein